MLICIYIRKQTVISLSSSSFSASRATIVPDRTQSALPISSASATCRTALPAGRSHQPLRLHGEQLIELVAQLQLAVVAAPNSHLAARFQASSAITTSSSSRQCQLRRLLTFPTAETTTAAIHGGKQRTHIPAVLGLFWPPLRRLRLPLVSSPRPDHDDIFLHRQNFLKKNLKFPHSL